MSHTVTVTAVPDETTDDYTYTIDGTCDSSCIAYRDCLKDWHRHPSEEYGWENGDWATKRVPEVHTFIDGTWMIRSGDCGAVLAAEYSPIEWSIQRKGFGIGTYGVDVDWDGDYWTVEAFQLSHDARQGSDDAS